MVKSILIKLFFFMKSNYVLYGIVQKYKGNSKIYPSHITDITIEGFGRSGNTFLVNIIRNLDSTIRIAHHTHSFASIKKSINLNIPTFILVRKPEQAISSAILKNNNYLISNLIDIKRYSMYSYFEFYKDLYSCKENVEIIKFEELILNPKKFVLLILKKIKLNFSDNEINSAIEKTLLDLKKDKRDVTKRQLGGKERDLLKVKIKDSLFKDIYFKKIENVYNKIINDFI